MCKDDEGVRVRKARAANSPAFEAETVCRSIERPLATTIAALSSSISNRGLPRSVSDYTRYSHRILVSWMPGPSTYHLFGTGILKSWSQARIRFHLCRPSIVPNDTALAPIKLVAVSMSSPVSHVMSFRSLDAYFLPNFLLLLFELLKCS